MTSSELVLIEKTKKLFIQKLILLCSTYFSSAFFAE